jgi:uncharacterized protein YcaQ
MPGSQVTLNQLRRYAVARTLFPPTSLDRAIDALGFIQADPIRAPARAQDLTLRHRVRNYRAGDLERLYPALDLEEGFFINYGFLRRADYLLMHPRTITGMWDSVAGRRARALLAFVRERGTAHPREIDAKFMHGKAVNYWGGSSNATTHLLGEMHYAGMIRVVRRDAGIRVYAAEDRVTAAPDADARTARLDSLVDIVVRAYAPLPARSLGLVISRLRYAAPQWTARLKAALKRAQQRLAHTTVDGVAWYWPAGERPAGDRYESGDHVRLLSPFDPLVWDRRRFELLWGWAYRFEAYTPAAKRTRGYYALPLLWRDRVIGWANASWKGDRLDVRCGFINRRPPEKAFATALDAELTRLRNFLV